jgi:hypothetical protein
VLRAHVAASIEITEDKGVGWQPERQRAQRFVGSGRSPDRLTEPEFAFRTVAL